MQKFVYNNSLNVVKAEETLEQFKKEQQCLKAIRGPDVIHTAINFYQAIPNGFLVMVA